MKRGKIFLGLVLFLLTAAFAAAAGVGGNISFNTTIEPFAPRLFMSPSTRIVLDDYTSPGAISEGGEEMIERIENYAFEGEQVIWSVLVWDKNGKGNIDDVYVKIFNEADNLKRGSCYEVEGCYGTPEPDSCENYNYSQCTAISGCYLLCDIIVDEAGSGDYTSIQDAVDAATSGELICVLPGTYNENINVNKAVIVQSANLHGAVIDCAGVGEGFTISSDSVTIDGFEITNCYDGIFSYGTDNSVIKNNIIHDNLNTPGFAGAGIMFWSDINDFDDNRILNNEIYNNDRQGIYIGGSYDIAIISEGNTISCNIIYSNGLYTQPNGPDASAYGIQLSYADSNTIDNNDIYSHSWDVTGSGYYFGQAIYLNNAYGNDLLDNKLHNNDYGVVQYTDGGRTVGNNNIEGNNIYNNVQYGVRNYDSAITLDAENNYWGCSAGPGNPGCDSASVNVDYDPSATSEFDIPDCESQSTPICEGTPDSCDVIEEEYKCEAETEGCYWYNGIRDIDIWEDEEHIIELNNKTMKWYNCIFTVETVDSMHGQYSIKAEAEDGSGLTGESAESETWFFNPTIALGINGAINFGTVRPGGTYKSNIITVGNAAEAGSGVILDMYIAGTDFYGDITLCPTSNVLKLENFRYYATNGAYNTCDNPSVDGECYDDIPCYMTGSGAPPNNNMQRIINHTNNLIMGEYPPGNVLSPGSEISLIFKLALPSPCNGNSFTDGSIKIYGEAV